MRAGRIFCAGGGVVMLAILLAPPSADAQCARGTRRVTRGERLFFRNTLQALKDAMPAPPAGWTVAEQTEIRAPRGICIGRELRPLSIDFLVRYEPVGSLIADASVVPAGHLDTDPATGAQVLVTVNAPREVFDGTVERMTAPEFPLAFRHARDDRMASVDLLLGDWSIFHPDDPAVALEAMAHFDIDLAYTRVQSILIHVDGPAMPVSQIMASLDVAALKQLLRR